MRTVDDRRAEAVLIGEGYEHPGRVCSACGALWADETTCPTCTAPTSEVPDVVGHLVVAALRQDAVVEVVARHAIPWPDEVVTIARF
jgi:hypothetical protein